MKRYTIGCAVLSLATAAFAAGPVSTTTYVWTGAEDAHWTNAANWTVGGEVATRAPGVIQTGAKSKSQRAAEALDLYTNAMTAAEFSQASANTTIDLDGLYLAGKILVTGATTPKYTFGTGSDQILRFMIVDQAGNYGNEFRIAADVTNMPRVQARFGAYEDDAVSGKPRSFASRSSFLIANETALPFEIEAVGALQHHRLQGRRAGLSGRHACRHERRQVERALRERQAPPLHPPRPRPRRAVIRICETDLLR